jgi:hypothetical protein
METETTMCVAAGGCFVLLIEIALLALIIIGLWKLFSKAGKPGWASVIPVYNTCMLIDIAGKPIWWFLLLLIPVVNIVIGVLVMIGLAKNFGRGAGTVIGLIFLPMIFLLILGFGSARYAPEAEALPPVV